MSYGEKIAEARKRKGLSQSELANKVGITSQMMSMIEAEKKIPGVKVAAEMAHILGMTLDEMFNG